MKIKRIIAGLLVVAVTIGSLWLLQRLLVPKYQTGIVEGSLIEEYYKDKSAHEVLFIGDWEV